MASPFVHLEVLGPRITLDRWLSVLQDHGGCHVADAMTTLQGEAGIGRPLTTPDEWEGTALRAAAARSLRAVERVLPPTPLGEDPRTRPAFTVGARGEGRDELEREGLEAEAVGTRVREALEAVVRAERDRDLRAAEGLALRALLALERPKVEGRAWVFPGDPAGAARLTRSLKAAGLDAALAEDARRSVVVACGGEGGDTATSALAAANDQAAVLALPETLHEKDLPVARESAATAYQAAVATFDQAQTALRACLAEDGPRARLLLDAIDDADRRTAARDRLAATDHVVAARVFVRREDERALRRQLSIAFGDEVLVRDLGRAADAPALPRAVAGLPFSALRGLKPARFGETATASLLALAIPLLVGATLADVGVGLLLLFTGALVGIGAPVNSPRRDTSLLAELGGLSALILGVLEGRAFGAVGATYLGTDWGLYPAASALSALGMAEGLIVCVGAVALLLALWGVVCIGVHLRRGHRTRIVAAVVGTLSALAVAGAAALALPGSLGPRLWLAFPGAAFAALLVAGPRLGLGRLVLDVLGVVRLVAAAYGAIFLFQWGFASVGAADPILVGAGAVSLVVAALLLTIDPAHVAMGIPYDLSLGSTSQAHPFTAFARRFVRPRGGATS